MGERAAPFTLFAVALLGVDLGVAGCANVFVCDDAFDVHAEFSPRLVHGRSVDIVGRGWNTEVSSASKTKLLVAASVGRWFMMMWLVARWRR